MNGSERMKTKTLQIFSMCISKKIENKNQHICGSDCQHSLRHTGAAYPSVRAAPDIRTLRWRPHRGECACHRQTAETTNNRVNVNVRQHNWGVKIQRMDNTNLRLVCLMGTENNVADTRPIVGAKRIVSDPCLP